MATVKKMHCRYNKIINNCEELFQITPLKLQQTRGRPAVEIRPLFIKFLSLNVIEFFLYQRIYLYNHCI
jgi:hypothetical protein